MRSLVLSPGARPCRVTGSRRVSSDSLMHVYSFCVVVVCAWRGYPTVSVLNSGSFNSRVRCSAGAWWACWVRDPRAESKQVGGTRIGNGM